VTPYSLQLPAKSFQRFRIVLENQQLVHQASHNVPGERQTRRRVAIMLALEPGALEEWLV
jgi:hypothetical protein